MAYILLVSLSLICFAQSTSSHQKCRLKEDSTPSCGVKGIIRLSDREKYPMGFSTIVASIPECAKLCARRGVRCLSFEFYQYDRTTSICTLSGMNIRHIIVPRQDSRKIYYNLDCWDCGDYCDQKVGENLLDNGDFEGKLLGPWQLKKVEKAVGENSSTSLKCYSKKGTCKGNQFFSTCGGRFYAYQIDYKSEADALEADLTASPNFQDGDQYSPQTSIYLEGSSLSDKWSRVRGIFQEGGQPGTHHEEAFSFSHGLTGHKYAPISIDNIKIVPIPDPDPPIPQTKSIVKNGGFESGNLSPWRGAKSSIIKSPGLSQSSHAAYVRRGKSVSIKQILTAVPDTLYFLSYQITVKPLHGQGFLDCFYSISLENISPGVTLFIERQILEAGSYTFIDYSYVSSSQVVLKVYDYCPADSSESNSDSIFDNIVMRPVDSALLSYLDSA